MPCSLFRSDNKMIKRIIITGKKLTIQHINIT